MDWTPEKADPAHPVALAVDAALHAAAERFPVAAHLLAVWDALPLSIRGLIAAAAAELLTPPALNKELLDALPPGYAPEPGRRVYVSGRAPDVHPASPEPTGFVADPALKRARAADLAASEASAFSAPGYPDAAAPLAEERRDSFAARAILLKGESVDGARPKTLKAVDCPPGLAGGDLYVRADLVLAALDLDCPKALRTLIGKGDDR